MSNTTSQLNRTLGPVMLWGLGVGYVISGMYFGWNYGLAEGGTLGLIIATFFIMVMYVTFSLSYSELACAIPKAGGAFDYAMRALGPQWGFVAGLAQIIEFVFAPPAIALGIGAYFHILIPEVDVLVFAISAYLIFTALNVIGVKASATFELFITIFAVIELLIFTGLTLPHFKVENFTHDAFPHGIQGIFAAIPFAIWFFLGLEGIANVAEETINPQKNILKGFSSAMITLAVLASLVLVSAVGVAGWKPIVFVNGVDGTMSDSPLPMALSFITGPNDIFYHLLVGIGIFGFIASFNGLLLAAGRATYEFGKASYLPTVLGKINPKFKTPHWALIANMVVGIAVIVAGVKADQIITIATFGALTLYIISSFSLFALRKKEPNLERPFRVPLFPLFPTIAASIAGIALVAMAVYNTTLFIYFVAIMLVGYIYFRLVVKKD
jgi:ethanolamine permease